MTESYDVVVIGSGPGGYVAGIKAAQGGLKTLVVEKERLGGVCLNWGCIPTKALLRSAELYEAVKDSETFGFSAEKLSHDPKKIVARSRSVADRMNKGVGTLFKKYKVAHQFGNARFLSPKQLEIQGENGKTETLEAKHVIIATGARAKAPDFFGVDGQTVLTYRDALTLTKFPKKLLIVGGGAIGVEFAYYFNAFGVDVHLVEMLPHLLPGGDAEVGSLLERAFNKNGIHCYSGTGVSAFKAGKAGVKATLKNKKGETELAADMALIAVGMEAVTEELDLARAGVRVTKGFIETNAAMATSTPGIYAIGDVTGKQMLAHKASAEAETAIAHILKVNHPAIDYNQIPACTYCQPQVASLGATENELKEKGIAYKTGKFPFMASGKATAIGHTEGMVKLLFGEPHGQLLGAHLIGPEVTELLAELGLAMKLEATYQEILATIHAHPTLSEAVFEAVGVAYNKSANF